MMEIMQKQVASQEEVRQLTEKLAQGKPGLSSRKAKAPATIVRPPSPVDMQQAYPKEVS